MGGNFRFTGIWDFSPEMVNGRPKMRYHVISGTKGTGMDGDEVSGYERCGEAYHPQIEECPSAGEPSRAPEAADTTETTPAAPAAHTTAGKTESPAAPRDPDAKFKELLAQAREIMQDPEFMEEVMALVRLRAKLQEELQSEGLLSLPRYFAALMRRYRE